MKSISPFTVASALLCAPLVASAPTADKRDVDTRYPYNGPDVPVGDWVDQTINGNGKGFIRLVEAPAVKPSTAKPKNSVNVINLAYIPGGMAIHYQTAFGLDGAPTVKFGRKASDLSKTATGYTTTYDRTPPCSEAMTTMCSQYFHNVLLPDLEPGCVYYYSIPSSNGTTASQTLQFTTAPAAGGSDGFTIAVLNDMGYTNAKGTHKYLAEAADGEVAFAWHGGDISYADDWFDGIIACEGDYVCYNGSNSHLSNTPPAPFPEDYNTPLPEGEIPNQGSPRGGDASSIYETNWDIWQQWMNTVSMKVPYMVSPGNHEAACMEFGDDTVIAYMNEDIKNGTAPDSEELTYYSCPPSQRNFTTYQHRFRMPGNETGGVSNFWYSFDYGNAHFITLDGETDFAFSPEYPFLADITPNNETLPTEEQTWVTDSGPFGYVHGNWTDNKSYEQIKWLEDDLKSIDRTKTPWVFAMTHRPMYSSEVSSYEEHVRNAFEPLLIQYNVDAYFAGHIHWYERIFPMNNMSIVNDDIIDNNTYSTGTGNSLTTIVNGMAGNVESHSSIDVSEVLNYTAVLNQYIFGFSKLTVHNDTHATWQYIKGTDGSVGDELTMVHSS